MKTAPGLQYMLLYDNNVNMQAESIYIQAGGKLTKIADVLQLSDTELYRKCYTEAIRRVYEQVASSIAANKLCNPIRRNSVY